MERVMITSEQLLTVTAEQEGDMSTDFLLFRTNKNQETGNEIFGHFIFAIGV
jgi:hypothetical protein